jgi:hypothetical protein
MVGDFSHHWQERFAELDAMPPDSDRVARQRRGTEFERVLHAMYEVADMEPRSRFRPSGEEIDGSFLYRGRPMLFEAKWTRDAVPASALYAFRGKLDGKLTGTLGLFISIGGFAEDAVDALIAGKSLNLLLFDGEDVRKLAKPDGISIEAAIAFKLRAAAEEGTPFVPLPDTDAYPSRVPSEPSNPVVIVEGSYDAAILGALINAHNGRLKPIFMPAMGRLNLPLVAAAQLSLLPSLKRLIIIADGDGKPDEVKRNIEQVLSETAEPADVEFVVLVIDPNLETALGLMDPAKRRRPPISALYAQLHRVDLARLAATDQELAHLLQVLGLID